MRPAGTTFVQSGAVQPHDGFTSRIRRSPLPVFFTTKSWMTGSPFVPASRQRKLMPLAANSRMVIVISLVSFVFGNRHWRAIVTAVPFE